MNRTGRGQFQKGRSGNTGGRPQAAVVRGNSHAAPLANAKHEAVALAYLTDPERVGWRAYRKVYPRSSRHAAECGFTRLQKNVEFSGRLVDLGEQAAQGAVMTAQETLERISARARDETEGNEALQLRALELIGKHHKLFTDKQDVNVAFSLLALIAESYGEKG